MMTLPRYQGVKPQIDPETDQTLIIVPRKHTNRGNDLFISKDGFFYVRSWQRYNDQETSGFYQISSEDAREVIKTRMSEMTREQRKFAEKIFPGIFG